MAAIRASGLARRSPSPVAEGSPISIRANVSECRTAQSVGLASESKIRGIARGSPILPNASAAARRQASEVRPVASPIASTSKGTASRSRQRPAAWIATWRTDGLDDPIPARIVDRAAGESIRHATRAALRPTSEDGPPWINLEIAASASSPRRARVATARRRTAAGNGSPRRSASASTVTSDQSSERPRGSATFGASLRRTR